MLELKKLNKTYKPKKGVPVRALKDISLSFEDSGMVFLLGKSGSGKSTLLNLIGGLDFADSGEIIIDGKSSKEFKQSDFDSYRNTYVGFVFQEYNILNEFSVGENITLALELQSQKSNSQRLEEVLKEVDLEGYADRKPNELSGGQKQRVAIARAIIKDPKIIMADEPTGALDSETGKAIFDTLKRLSKDRLVIVVSHDKEFAEQYGDRIIELADGEVISDDALASLSADSTKDKPSVELKKSRLPYRRALAMGAKSMRRKRFRLAITILLCYFSFSAFGIADVMVGFDVQKTITSNFYESDENYFSINAQVLEEDLRDYSSTVECSEEDLQKLREVTGLDFQGVIAAHYAPLVLDSDLLELDNGIEYYSAGDGRRDGDGGSLPASQELFDALGFKLYGRLPSNENEIVITRRRYEQYKLAGIDLRGNVEDIKPEEIGDFQDFLDNIIPRINDSGYLTGDNYGPLYIVGVVDTFADADGRLLNCQPNDIYHLNWTLRRYFSKGYHNLSYIHQSLYDKHLEESRGKENTDFGRAGGIWFTGTTSSKGVASQEALKYVDNIIWLDGKGDRKELAENEVVIGIDSAVKLWPAGNYFAESIARSARYDKRFFNNLITFEYMSLNDFRYGGASIVAYCEEAEKLPSEKLEIYKQYCKDIEYIFSQSDNIMISNCTTYLSSSSSIWSGSDPNALQEKQWRFSYACYLACERDWDIQGGYNANITGEACGKVVSDKNKNRIFVENRIEKALSSMRQIDARDYELNFSGTQHRTDYTDIKYDSAPTIVGIYFAKDGYPNDFMINDKAYYKSLDYEPIMYNFLIAPLSGSARTKDVIKLITNLHFDMSEFRTFYCNNPIYYELQDMAITYNTLKKFMYWGSAILGLFSILLLGNYIELSISSKKREIGILRAVGAKKSDILAIFINEGAIISAIIVTLAVIGTGFLTLGFNMLVPSAFGLTYNIKVLSFGIRQIAMLLALCFGTTAIAGAIPLYKLSKKKPVDSIQDR